MGNTKAIISESGRPRPIATGDTLVDGDGNPITGGGGVWGSITGTLAYQTDLNSALGDKVDTSGEDTLVINENAVPPSLTADKGKLFILPGTSIDADTQTLLHCNSPAVVDSSPNALAMTTTGNPVLSSTKYKFGGSSLYIDAVAPGYNNVHTESADDFTFGMGPFTVEGWVYLTSAFTPGQEVSFISIGTNLAGAVPFIEFVIRNTGLGDGINLEVYNSGVWKQISSGPLTGILPNVWNHIAYSRQDDAANHALLFLNGVLVATKQCDININGASYQAGVGPAGHLQTYATYYDEIRVSGVQRYTGNFTPQLSAFGSPTFCFIDSLGGIQKIVGGNQSVFDWAARVACASVYSTEITVAASTATTIPLAYPANTGSLVGLELIDVAGDIAVNAATLEPRINVTDPGTNLDCSVSSAGHNDSKAQAAGVLGYIFAGATQLNVVLTVPAGTTGTLTFRINLRTVEN